MPHDRIIRQWDDLVDSLAIGTVVNSYGLQSRLNGRYWTIARIGYYLRGDSRLKNIGREGSKGYMNYEVIG